MGKKFYGLRFTKKTLSIILKQIDEDLPQVGESKLKNDIEADPQNHKETQDDTKGSERERQDPKENQDNVEQRIYSKREKLETAYFILSELRDRQIIVKILSINYELNFRVCKVQFIWLYF